MPQTTFASVSSMGLVVMSISCLFLSSTSSAFVSPQVFASRSTFNDSGIKAIPASILDTFDVDLGAVDRDLLNVATNIFLSDEAQAMNAANSALEGLRSFFIVITAIVFGFAGLTFITAAFIVPKAAEQLEQDTRRIRPGLWEEFEARLEPGQTMATRPDLLQELGNIMQPLIIADFEASAEAKAKMGEQGAEASSAASVVDAEIVQPSAKSQKKGGSSIGVDANQWDD